jgi:hypothetical protein
MNAGCLGAGEPVPSEAKPPPSGKISALGIPVDPVARIKGNGSKRPLLIMVQIPVHRGQSFRRIADSIPVIADSFL